MINFFSSRNPRGRSSKPLGVILLVSFFVSSALASDSGTIVILGDSITAGYNLDTEEAYPTLIQAKVDAQELPFRVINAGQSGDTTAGGLRRINWVLREPPAVVVIALGGNDGLRGLPPEQVQSNLEAIVKRVRDQNAAAEIVVAGMQMPENMGRAYTDAFARVFETVAEENKTHLLPFLLENVGGVAEMNQADRIHPNAQGQILIAENLWEVLHPILADLAAKQPDDA